MINEQKHSIHTLRAVTLQGGGSLDDVFLCIYQNSGMYVIKKEMNSKDTFF